MLLSYGGNKMAVVKMKCKEAYRLQMLGHLTVRLVRCQVRKKNQLTRCFRCHGFSHHRAICKETDRTALCMTCSQENQR
ncbi:cellular nucleic acid-binding protein-like [Aphis craccivora]|uniref:Cellular nucleic acid-binding protein-like n=1 Tax=Aphis craccivora TaxID=307492 RepID=A0A6G0Y3N2_APHCR|nr:cellular nucleic acid-binding protein-like [Aphis craccivora]